MKEPSFKASLVLRTRSAWDASVLWSSIYPNFSPHDFKGGKLKAELKGHEIYIVAEDENLSKLRARLGSILVWLDMVCAILKISDQDEGTHSGSMIMN